MVKNGSSYLRKYLINSADKFYVFNPSIGRKKMNVNIIMLPYLMLPRRLINTIFYLEKHNQDFDLN